MIYISESENEFKLKVSLNGFNFSKCWNVYQRSSIYLKESGQFCAGGEDGVGACSDDGGNCIFYFEPKFMGIMVYLL